MKYQREEPDVYEYTLYCCTGMGTRQMRYYCCYGLFEMVPAVRNYAATADQMDVLCRIRFIGGGSPLFSLPFPQAL